MNLAKAYQWLDNRGIILEQDFATALHDYARIYQKEHKILHLEEVYERIGTNRQNVSWWAKNLCSTQTKNFEIPGGSSGGRGV